MPLAVLGRFLRDLADHESRERHARPATGQRQSAQSSEAPLLRGTSIQLPQLSEPSVSSDDRASHQASSSVHTASSLGSQLLDTRLAAYWAEHNILPFVCLLFGLFVIQHVFSLVQFVFLFTSTASSTLHLQALVSAPQEHKLFKVVDVLIIVSLNIWALSLLGLPDAEVWRAVYFKPPSHQLTIWQSFFYAAVTPLMIKQWMIVPKVLSALLFVGESGRAAGQRVQSSVLTMLEYLSIAWTDAIPVTIWFSYFVNTNVSSGVYGCCLAGTYIALKGQSYLKNVRDVVLACRHVFYGKQEYGTSVTKEEVMEAGTQCPICQDPPAMPLKLTCGHIYCGNCISEWLDRERTCPMCRSTVKHDALHSYGNGSTNMLPSIF